MKKYMIAFVLTALLTGCSDRNESSVSSESETTSAPESTAAADTTAAPEEITTAGTLQDADGYNIRVEADGVTVSQGSFFQKIELDCSELIRRAESYDRAPEEFLTVADFNFDGYDDLFVPDMIGTPNIPGTYFYMNPTREFNCFEEWDELNEIGQLMDIDDENQELDLAVKISAADYEYSVYKWGENGLVRISRKHYYVSGSGQYYTDYFEYDENGEEILVKQESGAIDEEGSEIVSEVSGR